MSDPSGASASAPSSAEVMVASPGTAFEAAAAARPHDLVCRLALSATNTRGSSEPPNPYVDDDLLVRLIGWLARQRELVAEPVGGGRCRHGTCDRDASQTTATNSRCRRTHDVSARIESSCRVVGGSAALLVYALA